MEMDDAINQKPVVMYQSHSKKSNDPKHIQYNTVHRERSTTSHICNFRLSCPMTPQYYSVRFSQFLCVFFIVFTKAFLKDRKGIYWWLSNLSDKCLQKNLLFFHEGQIRAIRFLFLFLQLLLWPILENKWRDRGAQVLSYSIKQFVSENWNWRPFSMWCWRLGHVLRYGK